MCVREKTEERGKKEKEMWDMYVRNKELSDTCNDMLLPLK